MKTIVFLFLLSIILSIVSCEKEKDCQDTNPVCIETPPTDELCEAYFQRWFYNNEIKSCEQVGYSGCSQYGFETKEECENCGCE